MKNYILASLVILAVFLSVALLIERAGAKTEAPQGGTAPAATAVSGQPAGAAPQASQTAPLDVFKGTVTERDSRKMVRWDFRSGVAPDTVKKDEPLLAFYTNNPPIRFSGIRGQSLFLNEGGSGEMLVTSDVGFPFKNAPRSMGAWLKTTSKTQPAVLNYGQEAPHARLSLMVSTAGKSMCANVGEDFEGKTVVNDGKWHFLVLTYDGKTANLYVDGELDGSRECALNTASGGRFELGSVRGEGSFFTGMINSVFVCNYALSAVSVKALAASRPSD